MLALSLAGAGCSEQGQNNSTAFTQGAEDGILDDSAEGGSGNSGGNSDGGDASGNDDSGDASPRFDVGAGGSADAGSGGDAGVEEGCNKVDVLLVVDASSSMESEMASLYATFLEMKTLLRNEVGMGIDDFHVAAMNACPNPPYLHNWGANGTNCQFPGAGNWLDSFDAQIDARFDCVIDIPFQDEALAEKGGNNGGYNGSPDFCADGPDEDEQPALAGAEAVQPGVGQNAGFVRDDAILLVVAITDEDEALADIGSPQAIYERYLQAKGGDPSNITFLGIGGRDCKSAYDGDDIHDSRDLRRVADAFGTRGLFRDMCQGADADPIRTAFQEMLTTVVDQACDEYIPPAG